MDAAFRPLRHDADPRIWQMALLEKSCIACASGSSKTACFPEETLSVRIEQCFDTIKPLIEEPIPELLRRIGVIALESVEPARYESRGMVGHQQST